MPTHLPPREFAKRMDMSPQLVYYYIRIGVLTLEPCECCGQKVLNVEVSTKQLTEHRSS